MSLVLQETSVQVKYWSHANLIKKQVKKCFSLKLDKILSIKIKCWSSTEAVFVENYEIKNSRFDYAHILEYLCKVSFLTTLDIYKNYFKGHCTRNYIPECFVWPKAEIALVHHSLCRSYYIFAPRVLWPMSFLIFIVEELKNFATNIFFKQVELVTY